MRQRRGIALITVLLVSMVIFTVVMVGLGLTGRNLLFVASTHQRNQALCAAEAGIYALFARLDSQPSFVGPLQGTLQDGSTYTVTFTRTGQDLTIRSTGMLGSARRSLRTTAKLSADAFAALNSEGDIRADRTSFVNGILGIRNPMAGEGNVHTNSSNRPAFNTSGKTAVSGTLSAVGTISGQVDGRTKPNAAPVAITHIDKNSLLPGNLVDGNIPANNVVGSNLRINGDLKADDAIRLENGAVLHVKGDVILRKGVTGQGTIVADGVMLVRGGSAVEMNNTKGITLYSDEDLYIAHPSVTFTDTGAHQVVQDPIGDFFAGMPDDVPYILNQGLPVDAPTGVDFFTWYKQQSQSPSATFREWRDGNGTQVSPGLPANVKNWLNSSIPLEGQLRQWGGQ